MVFHLLTHSQNSFILHKFVGVFEEFAKSLRTEAEFEKVKPKKGKGKKGKKKANKKKAEEIKVDEPEGEQEAPPFTLDVLGVPLVDLKRVKGDPIQIEPIDLQFIESDTDIIKLISESITVYTEQRITKIHNKCIKEALVELIENTKPEEEEEEEGKKEDDKKKQKKKKKTIPKPSKSTARGEVIFDPKNKETAYVCPVWTPPTARSHASILYLYFRRVFLYNFLHFSNSYKKFSSNEQLLSFFLPMDPPGADRYVIVGMITFKF